MDLDAGSAGAIGAAVGVPIVMWALAKVFPAGPAPAVGLTPEELRARYGKWEVALGLGALALAAPLGFGSWLALRALAAAHVLLLPPADLLWTAGPFYWAVPAILLGLVLAMPLSAWGARRLLRERYPEYVAFQRVKHGMDTERVGRVLATGVGAGCAIFVLLGLDWSVRLGPDGVAVNRYFHLGEERHAYAEVRAIRTAPALVAPNGNVVPRREFVVRFADGATWSTNNLLADASPSEKQRFADLLAERSGVAPEEADVLRNDEL